MKKLFLKSAFMLFAFNAILSCSSDNEEMPIQCSPGFSGFDCTSKITPSKVLITKVDVLSFPAYDYANGIEWDPNESGENMKPDIYFSISNSSGTVYVYNGYVENADYETTHSFPIANPIQIQNIHGALILEMRDFNASSNTYDSMGSTNPFFVYYPSDVGFPKTKTFTNVSTKISIKIHLSYQW